MVGRPSLSSGSQGPPNSTVLRYALWSQNPLVPGPRDPQNRLVPRPLGSLTTELHARQILWIRRKGCSLLPDVRIALVTSQTAQVSTSLKLLGTGTNDPKHLIHSAHISPCIRTCPETGNPVGLLQCDDGKCHHDQGRKLRTVSRAKGVAATEARGRKQASNYPNVSRAGEYVSRFSEGFHTSGGVPLWWVQGRAPRDIFRAFYHRSVFAFVICKSVCVCVCV